MSIYCILTGLHQVMNCPYELSLGKDDESQYMMIIDLLLSTLDKTPQRCLIGL